MQFVDKNNIIHSLNVPTSEAQERN